jgi:hypothetical protein
VKYIPSPIPIRYELLFTATANKSGRMQYHKVRPGQSKQRISRTEFIKVYNEVAILAMKPLPLKGQDAVFQLEFYV